MSTSTTRVALPGGFATGKSYCLTRFAELGAPTVDADVLAHRAIAPGTPGFDAVLARFGRGVLQPHGEIDRAGLGRLVFADATARRDLEHIIHPGVYEAIARWYAQLANSPGAPARPVGIADIPLLFETGRAKDFDTVLVASCPPELQVARLVKRNNLTEAEARQRLATQLPIDEKARRADYVIDTSGDRRETDRQVATVWSAILARP